MNCKKCNCAMDINVRNKDGELMCPYCVEIDRDEYQTKKCKKCSRDMELRNNEAELVCNYCGIMNHEIVVNMLSEQRKTSREILSRLDNLEDFLITIKYICRSKKA